METPFSPGASHPGAMTEEAGGGVFNAARAAHGRGARVGLASLRGDDLAGGAVAAAIAAAGLRDLGAAIPAARTASYTSLLRDDGEQIAGLADMAIYHDPRFGPVIRGALAAAAEARAGLVDANLSPDLLDQAAAALGERRLFAMMVSPAKALRWRGALGRIEVAFMNAAEARALGAPNGLRSGVITDGPRPALVFWPGGSVRLAAPRADVVDVTGAGDALTGATVAALLSGASLAEAVKEGLAAAHITVRSPLVAPPLDPREIAAIAAQVTEETS